MAIDHPFNDGTVAVSLSMLVLLGSPLLLCIGFLYVQFPGIESIALSETDRIDEHVLSIHNANTLILVSPLTCGLFLLSRLGIPLA